MLGEEHRVEMARLKEEYQVRLSQLEMMAEEARVTASTKTEQFTVASKRAHQQVLLISAELGRTERAVETQRELCDHLEAEVIKTKDEMARRGREYDYQMETFRAQAQLDIAKGVTTTIHLKRKLLLSRLSAMQMEDAVKRMKRQHKKHVASSSNATHTLQKYVHVVNKELAAEYETNDERKKEKKIMEKETNKLNENLLRTRMEVSSLEEKARTQSGTVSTLETSVGRLTDELATLKSVKFFCCCFFLFFFIEFSRHFSRHVPSSMKK